MLVCICIYSYTYVYICFIGMQISVYRLYNKYISVLIVHTCLCKVYQCVLMVCLCSIKKCVYSIPDDPPCQTHHPPARERGQRGAEEGGGQKKERERESKRESEGERERARARARGSSQTYRGTSLIRNRLPVGTCSRTMRRALWWSVGGGGGSYERSTPLVLTWSWGLGVGFSGGCGWGSKLRSESRITRLLAGTA